MNGSHEQRVVPEDAGQDGVPGPAELAGQQGGGTGLQQESGRPVRHAEPPALLQPGPAVARVRHRCGDVGVR